MAKVRVNMRLREDLWDAVKRTAAADPALDQTAVVERALEEHFDLVPVKVPNGRVTASPSLTRGVTPRPKARRRR